MCRDTRESKTDKGALLFKKSKGTAAKLSYPGHLLMENRQTLAVDAQPTQGADKNYDTRDCVGDFRCANVTPDVAQSTSNRSSSIDGRTARHPPLCDQPDTAQAH